jgi:hypothetical protein|tara:strand:- start:137 stop:370 length:234 start_codon:yes stop_codon:yes gene_type:complete
LFNIGRTISEDIPAILGIPNLIPIEILLIFNESESLKLSSSISDCALNDIEKNNKKNKVIYLEIIVLIKFVFSLISV